MEGVPVVALLAWCWCFLGGYYVQTRCHNLLCGRRPWTRSAPPRSGGRHRGALAALALPFPL
jgi:hypothetical protein